MYANCPACGAMVDAHTILDRESTEPGKVYPEDGDVSVCLYCAAVGVFRTTPFGVTIEHPTEEERAKLAQDDDLQRMVAALRRVHLQAWQR